MSLPGGDVHDSVQQTLKSTPTFRSKSGFSISATSPLLRSESSPVSIDHPESSRKASASLLAEKINGFSLKSPSLLSDQLQGQPSDFKLLSTDPPPPHLVNTNSPLGSVTPPTIEPVPLSLSPRAFGSKLVELAAVAPLATSSALSSHVALKTEPTTQSAISLHHSVISNDEISKLSNFSFLGSECPVDSTAVPSTASPICHSSPVPANSQSPNSQAPMVNSSSTQSLGPSPARSGLKSPRHMAIHTSMLAALGLSHGSSSTDLTATLQPHIRDYRSRFGIQQSSGSGSASDGGSTPTTSVVIDSEFPSGLSECGDVSAMASAAQELPLTYQPTVHHSVNRQETSSLSSYIASAASSSSIRPLNIHRPTKRSSTLSPIQIQSSSPSSLSFQQIQFQQFAKRSLAQASSSMLSSYSNSPHGNTPDLSLTPLRQRSISPRGCGSVSDGSCSAQSSSHCSPSNASPFASSLTAALAAAAAASCSGTTASSRRSSLNCSPSTSVLAADSSALGSISSHATSTSTAVAIDSSIHSSGTLSPLLFKSDAQQGTNQVTPNRLNRLSLHSNSSQSGSGAFLTVTAPPPSSSSNSGITSTSLRAAATIAAAHQTMLPSSHSNPATTSSFSSPAASRTNTINHVSMAAISSSDTSLSASIVTSPHSSRSSSIIGQRTTSLTNSNSSGPDSPGIVSPFDSTSVAIRTQSMLPADPVLYEVPFSPAFFPFLPARQPALPVAADVQASAMGDPSNSITITARNMCSIPSSPLSMTAMSPTHNYSNMPRPPVKHSPPINSNVSSKLSGLVVAEPSLDSIVNFDDDDESMFQLECQISPVAESNLIHQESTSLDQQLLTAENRLALRQSSHDSVSPTLLNRPILLELNHKSNSSVRSGSSGSNSRRSRKKSFGAPVSTSTLSSVHAIQNQIQGNQVPSTVSFQIPSIADPPPLQLSPLAGRNDVCFAEVPPETQSSDSVTTDSHVSAQNDVSAQESVATTSMDSSNWLVCRICEERIAPDAMNSHSEWCMQIAKLEHLIRIADAALMQSMTNIERRLTSRWADMPSWEKLLWARVRDLCRTVFRLRLDEYLVVDERGGRLEVIGLAPGFSLTSIDGDSGSSRHASPSFSSLSSSSSPSSKLTSIPPALQSQDSLSHDSPLSRALVSANNMVREWKVFLANRIDRFPKSFGEILHAVDLRVSNKLNSITNGLQQVLALTHFDKPLHQAECADASISHSAHHHRRTPHKTSIHDFDVIKPVSRGAFGVVYLAQKRTTGDFYAIKVLKKEDVATRKNISHVRAEREILAQTSSDYVVKLFYSFQNHSHLYLVLEYMPGGDCFSLLRTVGCLPCHDVSRYAADIVLALQYLHERGIVHRDLKPDNLLVARNGHLKLTDFGLSHAGMLQISGISTNFNIASPSSSHNHQENTQLSSPTACTSTNSPLHSPHQLLDFVGTPDYLAPEILLGSGYGPLADLWSLGIVIFEFLFGAPPFTGESRDEIFHRILHDQIDWQSLPLQDLDVSNEAIDLLKRLLVREPTQRLTISAMKQHAFFSDIDWTTHIHSQGVFLPQLESDLDTSYFEPRQSVFPVLPSMTAGVLSSNSSPAISNHSIIGDFSNMVGLKLGLDGIPEEVPIESYLQNFSSSASLDDNSAAVVSRPATASHVASPQFSPSPTSSAVSSISATPSVQLPATPYCSSTSQWDSVLPPLTPAPASSSSSSKPVSLAYALFTPSVRSQVSAGSNSVTKAHSMHASSTTKDSFAIGSFAGDIGSFNDFSFTALSHLHEMNLLFAHQQSDPPHSLMNDSDEISEQSVVASSSPSSTCLKSPTVVSPHGLLFDLNETPISHQVNVPSQRSVSSNQHLPFTSPSLYSHSQNVESSKRRRRRHERNPRHQEYSSVLISPPTIGSSISPSALADALMSSSWAEAQHVFDSSQIPSPHSSSAHHQHKSSLLSPALDAWGVRSFRSPVIAEPDSSWVARQQRHQKGRIQLDAIRRDLSPIPTSLATMFSSSDSLD